MCAGFGIERRDGYLEQSGPKNQSWVSVGFVQGHGTTAAPNEYSFSNKALVPGQFSYRLKQIDLNGKFKYSPEINVTINPIPAIFSLGQNYPNPFNPTTTISYQIPTNGYVAIKVFDVIGREITTLVNEYKPAGSYTIQFDAFHLSSGTYFYTFQSGEYEAVKKLLVIK